MEAAFVNTVGRGRRRDISPTVGVLTPIDDAHGELVAGSNSLDGAALWVGLIGAPFEVHEPLELRATPARLGALLSSVA